MPWSMVLFVAVLLGYATAGPIRHDAIKTIPQDVALGHGNFLLFQPFLKVFSGCVPFPAVDVEGHYSGGLHASGCPSCDCSKSSGQVYARGGDFRGKYAIMYAWYFPKDEPEFFIGHRHDWEGCIVWLDHWSSPNPYALSVSGHGGWTTRHHFATTREGRPYVGYMSVWFKDHEAVMTQDRGGTQPLIDWDAMSGAARQTLQDVGWGKAVCPFNDHHFYDNLSKAFPK